jgi:hypothetical protein
MECLSRLSEDSTHTDFTMKELTDLLVLIGDKIINNGIICMPSDDPEYGKQWRKVISLMREKTDTTDGGR